MGRRLGVHPADFFLTVAGLGALYVHFGALQPVTAIFYGVSPVVIALILHSCYRLAKLGMEDWLQWYKAGALTFGSGLVIVPVVITATFVGYLVAGFWGAVAATVGIFLPSFFLVLRDAPILARHRANLECPGIHQRRLCSRDRDHSGKRFVGPHWHRGLANDSYRPGDLDPPVLWKVINPLLMATAAVVRLIAFPLLRPVWVMVQ